MMRGRAFASVRRGRLAVGSFILDNYYLINLFFTVSYVSALLVYLGRFNLETPAARAYQRMLLAVLAWAFFDFAVWRFGRTYPPETAFALYRWLGFLLLLFPPTAAELIISLLHRVTRRTRLWIYGPFAAAYLIALAAPSLVSAGLYHIPGGHGGLAAPWNVCFHAYSLVLILGLLFKLAVNLHAEPDPLARREKLVLLLGGVLTLAGVYLSLTLAMSESRGLPLLGALAAVFINAAAFWSLRRYGRVLSPRAMYGAIVGATPNAMVHLRGGRVTWANENMARLLDLDDPEKMAGLEVLGFLDPDAREPRELQDLAERLCRGEVSYEVLTVMNRRGKAIPCLVTAAPFDENDPAPGALAVFMDYTERKREEEEKLLREKLLAAIETSGAVCHELNQPLQIITGRIEVLLLKRKGDRELRRELDILLDQTDRIGEITKRLQKLNRYRTKMYAEAVHILDLEESSY